MASKAHPGFKAVQNRIAKRQGISKDRAGAILANAARNASPAAKKANPRLNRVRGASPMAGAVAAAKRKGK
jgi:hypothetical protein